MEKRMLSKFIKLFFYLCLFLAIFTLSTADVYSFWGVAKKPVVEGIEHTVPHLAGSGVKKATGGKSAVLAKRLGGIPKDFQAHHIIPSDCISHPALNKVGFDLDQAINGIALPSRAGLSKLPYHRGFHASYNRAVMRDLDEIPKNLSEEETLKRILGIIEKHRKIINTPGTNLYNYGGRDAWK